MLTDGAFDESAVEDDYRGRRRVTNDYRSDTRLFGDGGDGAVAGWTVPGVDVTTTSSPLSGVVAR